MPNILLTDSALRAAVEADFPELVEELEVQKAAGVDSVTVDTDDDGNVAVAPNPGVMVAWMLPSDPWDVKLTVEGGVPDHHVTFAFLGDAADLTPEQQVALLGVVAEVAQRTDVVSGTIEGTGTFDNDGEVAWWAGVNIPDLAPIREDLVSALQEAGLPVDTTFPDWQPHVTLAYLPEGTEPPSVDVTPTDANVEQLTVMIGGTRFDFPLQTPEVDDDGTGESVEPGDQSRTVTPFVPIVTNGIVKALGDESEADADEWRYTLAPVYMPGQVDAHGDSITADDLEHAIHDYVRTGNRDIHLQHSPDVVAGEWVGLLVWPWPVTIPVFDEGQLVQRTFPAGTPFMGVVWTPEAWQLIKAGLLRGYSLGGTAEFVTADIDDSSAPLEKFNPYHDKSGRFGTGPSLGESYTSSPGDVTDMQASKITGPHIDANGNFSPERQALHAKIIKSFLRGTTPAKGQPVEFMNGGGPGSGKSSMTGGSNAKIVGYPTTRAVNDLTGAMDFKGTPRPGAVLIDPDAIKMQLPEVKAMRKSGDMSWAAESHAESSYISGRIRRAAHERGVNIVTDGTGDSGAGKVQAKVAEARSHGYKVEANYLHLNPEEGVSRAMARAAHSGRLVPESVIRKTYGTIAQVFPQVKEGTFDRVRLFDNDGVARGEAAKLIGETATDGHFHVIDQGAYDKMVAGQ